MNPSGLFLVRDGSRIRLLYALSPFPMCNVGCMCLLCVMCVCYPNSVAIGLVILSCGSEAGCGQIDTLGLRSTVWLRSNVSIRAAVRPFSWLRSDDILLGCGPLFGCDQTL